MPPTDLDDASLVREMREAMYGTTPEKRLDALRKLAADAGNTRSEMRHAQTTEVISRVAESDENEVLREIALGYLGSARSDDAFETWFRIALPASNGPIPAPVLATATQLAGGLHPFPLNRFAFAGARDVAEERRIAGERSLRVARRLLEALPAEIDGNRSWELRSTIVRLAERAILDSGSERTVQDARGIREQTAR